MHSYRILSQLVRTLHRSSANTRSIIVRAQIGWPLFSLPTILNFGGVESNFGKKLKSYLPNPIQAIIPGPIMGDTNPDSSNVDTSSQPASAAQSDGQNKPSERMETLQEHLAQRTAEQPQQNTQDAGEADGSSQSQTKIQKTDTAQDDGAKSLPPSSGQPRNTHLYVNVEDHQWPIVYSTEYNIGFLGMEKMHPFDSGKWGKVYQFLTEAGMLSGATIVRPLEATEADLLVVHSPSYISSLRENIGSAIPEWSITVAGITEVPPVALLPNFIVQKKVLKPLRVQTGGTILAAKLAMERGWAINLGGGFHHCSSDRGGGFCAYADITLAIKFLMELGLVRKAMIVDLDAHQGNGHERDFMNMTDSVYIMDAYNRNIYPHDAFARRGIRRRVELDFFTADEEYLEKVHSHLKQALEEFEPDIIVYNAGTDCLEGDPLGALSITAEGIRKRDQIVFQMAKKQKAKPIPVVMVTSGGYQRNNARIIADSILNLRQKGLIGCQAAEEYQVKHKNNTGSTGTPSTPEGATTPSSSSGASSPTSPTSESRTGLFGWFRK